MAVCEYSAHDVTVSRREARRDRMSVLAVPVEVGRRAGRRGGIKRGADTDGAGLDYQHVQLTFRRAICLMELQGGGLYLSSSSSATITSSTISDNSAVSD